MNSYHKPLSSCENSSRFSHSSSRATMSPGNYRYPEVKTPLRRQVHGPSRVRRIGLSACTRQIHRQNRSSPQQVSGNFLTNALDLPLFCDRTDREVIDVDDDDEVRVVEVISDDSSMDFEIVENIDMEMGKANEVSLEVENESLMVDDDDDDDYTQATKKSSLVLDRPVTDIRSFEAYRKVLDSARNRTSILKVRGFGDYLKERGLALLQSLRSFWHQDEEPGEDVQREAFLPISKEDETAVKRAFSSNNLNILVTHENSNIDITVENLRCLRPGQWLNDEVINLYLVLLKEREAREPKKFLKCHFFNTFFFTKLVNPKTGYNYGAVRRWTSMKKLGYHLKDCDKIFVPIHMNIHWTLAVINIKDRKFQYLDSFKGREPKILDALARYFVDEVRDKSEIDDIDISWWKREFVQDLPEQKNGFDCGMFMLKYIDFYSRGLDLCFTEEQMPYFRVRTAKEILLLKAE